jgi:predicted RNA-binding Zn-ribbon protein involved in translation (DUF1610 family)
VLKDVWDRKGDLLNHSYLITEKISWRCVMRKHERDNVLRCLNCLERMEIPLKAKRFTCPKCKLEYYIGWRDGQAKILGTVEQQGG